MLAATDPSHASRRRRFRAASVAVVLTLLAASSVARASEASDAALDLFEKSEVAYRSGQFAEAVRLLGRAYELNPEPVLLYNMGRAYEGLGDSARAVQAYERYLSEEREVPDRPALERRVATLRKSIEERERLEREVQMERRGGAGPWPWIVAGAGAVVVGLGAGAGAIALAKKSDAERDPTQAGAARVHGQAEDFAVLANVGFIGGGVIAATGIAWGLLTLPKQDPAKVARFGVTARGSFVELRGQF